MEPLAYTVLVVCGAARLLLRAGDNIRRYTARGKAAFDQSRNCAVESAWSSCLPFGKTVRSLHVPSQVPSHPQKAAKLRGSVFIEAPSSLPPAGGTMPRQEGGQEQLSPNGGRKSRLGRDGGCGPRSDEATGKEAAANNVRTRRTILVTPKRRPGRESPGWRILAGARRSPAPRSTDHLEFGNIAIAWDRFAPFASGSRITRWRI
jgi:hypothetical protein